jgi:hypothetical protein
VKRENKEKPGAKRRAFAFNREFHMSASASTIHCHHIRTNGHPCGSPALRGEQFCYYHHPTRRRPRARGRKTKPPVFHLPTLQNRPSIQRGLAKIVSRVRSGRLDRKTAGLFFYALQIANDNLPGDPLQLANRICQAQEDLSVPPFSFPFNPFANL